MRDNLLRQRWQQGRHSINGWLQLPCALSAEVMAHAGFDSLTLDLQHGPIGIDSALAMLQAISTTPTVPLCRVPWNEPGVIMRMLDAGCYGIICPMVNTAAEAEAFVRSCRYPPQGFRSYGPTRARLYAGDDYAQHANATVLCIAMIETAEALGNLESILAVPGLDAIYVGPADLSQALGGAAGVDFREGAVADALETILSSAKKHGIYAGIHTGSSDYAQAMLQAGFSFVTVQSDVQYLGQSAQAVLERLPR